MPKIIHATSWWVGEDVRDSGSMSDVPHAEVPMWQSQIWDRQGFILSFPGPHSSGFALGLQQFPWTGENVLALWKEYRVFFQDMSKPPKIGWDLFWCQMNAQGSHQEVGDFPNFMVPKTVEDTWAVCTRHQEGRLLWNSSHSSSRDGWKSHLNTNTS